MLNIVNVGYDSTNYYVIETDKAKLLIDIGWPGTLPKLLHALKRKGIPLSDLTFVRKSHVSNRNSDLRLGGFRPKFTGFQMVLLRQKLTSRRLSYEHPLGCTAAAS
jgi:hypothetical protein